MIEATPDGAAGKQYLVAVDIGEAGQPSSIFLGGHYEDVYAKTPEGWRLASVSGIHGSRRWVDGVVVDTSRSYDPDAPAFTPAAAAPIVCGGGYSTTPAA